MVENVGIVVTGTLPICGYYAYIVCDSGSTHYFIALAFVRQTQLEIESLGYELLVSIPSRAILMTCDKVKVDKVVVSDNTSMFY